MDFNKKRDLINIIRNSYINDIKLLKIKDFFKSRNKKYSLNTISKEREKHLKKNNNPIDIYVHIPFCKSQCNYCCYKSMNHNPKLESSLVRLIKKEISFFKKKFANIKINALHIGGGTPNILNNHNLKKIYNNIFNNFEFKQNATKKIEFNPFFTTQKKIKTIKKAGFNKISFGVQSIDSQVLNKAGRGYQTKYHIKKALENAKKYKFQQINTDLLLGLIKDNNNKFIKSLSFLMQLKPTTIIINKIMPNTFYQKHISNNTKDIIQKQYEQNSLFKKIKKLAKKYSYNLEYNDKKTFLENNLLGLCKKNAKDQKDKDDYSFIKSKPSSCLGLGLFAQSHIFGQKMYQNQVNLNKLINSRKKIYTGNSITIGLELLFRLVQSYQKNGYINLKEIDNSFNIDFKKKYNQQIKRLKKNNKIKLINNIIYIKQKPINTILFFLNIKELKKIITLIKNK